ncbi:MAG: hypothetical protein QF884_05595 [Porticoccaceae bacterium]|jgi:hypothetical protein|nr:hypothetical protein [Porticoccaceae bacterium]
MRINRSCIAIGYYVAAVVMGKIIVTNHYAASRCSMVDAMAQSRARVNNLPSID